MASHNPYIPDIGRVFLFQSTQLFQFVDGRVGVFSALRCFFASGQKGRPRLLGGFRGPGGPEAFSVSTESTKTSIC